MKEIEALEKLVGEFDFLLQEGVIMTHSEYLKATKLAENLEDIIGDFQSVSDEPNEKDKRANKEDEEFHKRVEEEIQIRIDNGILKEVN